MFSIATVAPLTSSKQGDIRDEDGRLLFTFDNGGERNKKVTSAIQKKFKTHKAKLKALDGELQASMRAMRGRANVLATKGKVKDETELYKTIGSMYGTRISVLNAMSKLDMDIIKLEHAERKMNFSESGVSNAVGNDAVSDSAVRAHHLTNRAHRHTVSSDMLVSAPVVRDSRVSKLPEPPKEDTRVELNEAVPSEVINTDGDVDIDTSVLTSTNGIKTVGDTESASADDIMLAMLDGDDDLETYISESDRESHNIDYDYAKENLANRDKNISYTMKYEPLSKKYYIEGRDDDGNIAKGRRPHLQVLGDMVIDRANGTASNNVGDTFALEIVNTIKNMPTDYIEQWKERDTLTRKACELAGDEYTGVDTVDLLDVEVITEAVIYGDSKDSEETVKLVQAKASLTSADFDDGIDIDDM